MVVFCSDDTPHVPDEKLGEAAVLEIVERLTSLIREAFPGEALPSVPQVVSAQEHNSNKETNDNDGIWPGPTAGFTASISHLLENSARY